VAVWVLVAVVALAIRDPLPGTAPGRLALGGLAALTALTGVSLAWTPLGGQGGDDLSRLLLYCGFLLAAVPLLRSPPARAAVAPGLLALTTAAALYGLSERLLPALIALERSPAAGDRLAQPLTYWNATGAFAAFGLALAAGLVARGGRAGAAAAACAPPLGLALYLTFSRGAIGAAVGGLAVLLVAGGTRAHVRAALLVAGAAAIPAAASLALDGVTRPDGPAGEGVAMLAVLVATAAAAAAVARRPLASRGAAPRARRAVVVAAAVALVAAAAAAFAAAGPGAVATREGPDRLASAQTNRGAYWRVALGTWSDHPLAGRGAGAFQVEWLRERPFRESVRDAHSLYLETAAELGVAGLLSLAALLAGGALAARRAGPPAAGVVAALAVFALHAGVDWDWEIPAFSLAALAALACLVAAAEDRHGPSTTGRATRPAAS
jgi:hypothetical protein